MVERSIYARLATEVFASEGTSNPTKNRRMVEHHLFLHSECQKSFPLFNEGIGCGQIALSTIHLKANRHPRKGA